MTNEIMKVHSEIADLRKVIIHQPDFGIEKVTPEDAEELLYDDIVYFPRMLEEHLTFTNSLRSFLGDENVLEFEGMLRQTIQDTDVRAQLLLEVQELEKISDSFLKQLQELEDGKLSKLLIAGAASAAGDEKFNPLPNLIFTRDLGVAINDYFVVCSAATNARIRESLLSSFIFRFHPLFRKKAAAGKVIDLYQAFKNKKSLHSLEGGDMMIINEDHVFIGCSERSNEAGIKYLAQLLLEKEVVKYISPGQHSTQALLHALGHHLYHGG